MPFTGQHVAVSPRERRRATNNNTSPKPPTESLAFRTRSEDCVLQLHAALTCFEENDLVVLTQVHETRDALGELHHVLDGVGDVDGALLPHHVWRLDETGQDFIRTVNTQFRMGRTYLPSRNANIGYQFLIMNLIDAAN